MKISEILDIVNTFEKNNFLRIIEQIISSEPRNLKKIDKILNNTDGQIKNADNLSVEEIFYLVENEFEQHILREFSSATSQLDILVDILIRDGNSLMSREWLLKLYEKEIRKIKSKSKQLKTVLDSEDEEQRVKDYRLYCDCLKTAYTNDIALNRDCKVTIEEQSILNTISNGLDLSHEEIKLINYSVVPLNKREVDDVINYLVKIGIIMYSKKHHQIFVPDGIVKVLRKIRGKQVSNKIFLRVLKQLRDGQINLISRKHNIDRALSREEKIKEIINEGVPFSKVLLSSAHKDGTTKTDKKKFLTDLVEKKLEIDSHIKGLSLEDKFQNLVDYLNEKESSDNISVSLHGYDKLLYDLKKCLRSFERNIRVEFELQDTTELKAKSLLNHNLKPIDILYALPNDDIIAFCEKSNISKRGNEILNILDEYRDTQNLYLENYINISNRDINELKANNIEIKESELGIQYENLTKLIFQNMGLDIDEKLRKRINTVKDKIDIIIKLDDEEIIIVECKTKKDTKFNKYSSASRQIKSYKDLALKAGLKVSKTFIIAPSFTDEFINECGLDYDLNLSLITSEALIDIYQAFEESGLDEFPYKILLRDVLIDSQRVIRSLKK
ncbi:hypothetical protein [Allomuricauda sp. d1]|uniref:hypothetical protein n=1 Tax=Allomuricauda sp. d1 TaxID=3136725 RepID=UPI0031DD736E